jgi:hypothetical protein
LAAIVSESFARRFSPAADPIGRRIRRATPSGIPDGTWTTVVGVVSDVYDARFAQPPHATVYVPYAHGNSPGIPVALVVRTAGDPLAAAATVQAAVWTIDPAQPLARIGTIDRFLSDSLGPQRMRTVLLGTFGALGLLLAGVGIYGVTTRAVIERRHEIGVRLALGGHPRRVRWDIAAPTLRWLAAGAGTGIAAAMMSAAPLKWFFPEVADASARQPVLAAALVLVAGVTTACMAARRVSSVNPMVALREES